MLRHAAQREATALRGVAIRYRRHAAFYEDYPRYALLRLYYFTLILLLIADISLFATRL